MGTVVEIVATAALFGVPNRICVYLSLGVVCLGRGNELAVESASIILEPM